LRRNLIKQLLEHERITTTRAKAEAVRGQVERLITLAKLGNAAGEMKMVNARRLAAARLNDAKAVRRLFDDIAPRYESKAGGYTRMIKAGLRRGDSAEMVVLELVEE
jgi:large subunit ribosomal protein L17